MSSAKTIILKGMGIRNERVANAAITPGHLVETMSTGYVRVHATAGGHGQKAFAVEDDLQGNTISTAYATSGRVQYEVMQRGAVVNALIADGSTVVIGSPLESAGDGTLQVYVADDSASIPTNNIVGYAIEALDLSDSSGADPASARCAVEVA